MKAMYAVAISALIGLLSFRISNAQPEQEMHQMYFDNLKERNYNTKIAPEGNDGNGSPVKVLCTMYIIDIHKIDDLNMEYRASFYFRQKWNDSRLAYMDMDIGSIKLSDDQYIWTPDLFFIQEKDGKKHGLTTPNVFIEISPDGEVHYSARLSLTFSCEMDFRNYPHDSQKCKFHIESYSKKVEEMLIDWDYRREKSPVQQTSEINILPFELGSVDHGSSIVKLSQGSYKTLIITLTFHRKIGFYITRLFVPFIILVILSWLSFWIKAKMAVLRLPLLLAIMYIMINIGTDVNCYIPPAPYTKASDVWIAVCESLVFAAFLEFIFVSVVAKSEKKLNKQRSSISSDPEAPMISDSKEKSANLEKMNSAVQKVASRLSGDKKLSEQIDRISRMVFPLLFVLFNLIYWLVY